MDAIVLHGVTSYRCGSGRPGVCRSTSGPHPGFWEKFSRRWTGMGWRTRRQCFLDCSGALRVAMGSDPGNPEWFPRWDLWALLIRSTLFSGGAWQRDYSLPPHFPHKALWRGGSSVCSGKEGALGGGWGQWFLSPSLFSSVKILRRAWDIPGLGRFRREAAGCHGDPGPGVLRANHVYIQVKLVKLIIKGQPEGRERIPERKWEIWSCYLSPWSVASTEAKVLNSPCTLALFDPRCTSSSTCDDPSCSKLC